MVERKKPLREAESRESMRPFNVWLPDWMHDALTKARTEDGISLNEAIRQAVRAWLTRRRARARRK